MGISSYSTTPSSNSAIGGTNIAEGCPPGNVNDAIRKLMADIRSELTDAVLSITAKATVADIRTALNALEATDAVSAIKALTPAADRLPYYTGVNTAALTVLSSFARAILDDADAATMRGTLGALGAIEASLASPGYIKIGIPAVGTLVLQWGTNTTGSNGASGAYSFPTPFASSCFGVLAAPTTANPAAADGNAVSAQVLSTSQFTLSCDDVARPAFWIAVGV